MKHFTTTILTVLISFFCFQNASSQGLLKNLKAKTQKKIEQRIEERATKAADEEIDNQLDKAEEAIFKSENTNSENEESIDGEQFMMMDMMKKMGVGGEPVPVQDSYSFNHLIQMHIESQNKQGEKTSEGEFITHLSPNSGIMGYEFVSGDMADPSMGFIIVDSENSATIILSEEQDTKTGIVYGLGTLFDEVKEESLEEMDMTETPETYLANPNVSKTGRSKTIAGYKCEEYKYSDENTESNIWITKDLKMNSKDFFGTIFKTSLYSHGMAWGYMLEATTLNKENGEKSIMTVTKIDNNSNKKVVMSDYDITNIGSFSGATKE